MDISIYLSRFLYRLRYKLILGSILVAGFVAYFSRFIPLKYTVSTSIYTGIASSSGLQEEKLSYFELNNTFENIINLTKAKGTLENVSLKLFAYSMIYGDMLSDSTVISAKNYNRIYNITPDEVRELIDRSSFENTLSNLRKYKKDVPGNFFFNLFNGTNRHFSYGALEKVHVKRVSNSDVIEISFQSDDPGLALHSVRFINDELINAYDEIRYKAANDVVGYYQEQLKTVQDKLVVLENEMTRFKVEHKVINFPEQTKAVAISYTNYEDRYEQVEREYQSSLLMLRTLEERMGTKVKLFKTKEEFLKSLDKIAKINSKITELESMGTESYLKENYDLIRYKQILKSEEDKINTLQDNISDYKYTKEGVVLDEMVSNWLKETIRNTKAKAELTILTDRREEYTRQYRDFSPIGAEINRMEREIRVTENTYLEMLHSLNLAKLKQKNIQLTSATLNVITAPVFPIKSDGSKRKLLVISALMGSIIFILGFFLLIELLDRTLRDACRAERLTGTPVLGAFTGHNQLKFRGYIKACNRISASYACNRLNRYLTPGKPIYINLLSIEAGEGKTFVSGYLIEHWEEQGLKVKSFIANKDFTLNPDYYLASDFGKLGDHTDNQSFDIILVEHPAVQSNSIPASLLNKADVNILIANACRVWKNSDNIFMSYLKEMSGETPIFMYLNNAQRDVVEDFTGFLPPFSIDTSMAGRIKYMGITARDAAVKVRK